MEREKIITTLFKRPDTSSMTISANIDMATQFLDYAAMDRIIDALAERAVKEYWEKHGTSILRKVDKKTVGNLTVKKLSALIAKELSTTNKE